MEVSVSQKKWVLFGQGNHIGNTSFYSFENSFGDFTFFSKHSENSNETFFSNFNGLMQEFVDLNKKTRCIFQYKLERMDIVRTINEKKDFRTIYISASEIIHPVHNDILHTGYHYIRTTNLNNLPIQLPKEIIQFINANKKSYINLLDYPIVLGKEALSKLLESIVRSAYQNVINMEHRNYFNLSIHYKCLDDPHLYSDNPNKCDYDDVGIKVKPSYLIDNHGFEIQNTINNGHFMKGDIFGDENSKARWSPRCLTLLIQKLELNNEHIYIGDVDVFINKDKLFMKCNRVSIREKGRIKYLTPSFSFQTTVRGVLEKIKGAVSDSEPTRGKHFLPDVEIEGCYDWR